MEHYTIQYQYGIHKLLLYSIHAHSYARKTDIHIFLSTLKWLKSHYNTANHTTKDKIQIKPIDGQPPYFFLYFIKYLASF